MIRSNSSVVKVEGRRVADGSGGRPEGGGEDAAGRAGVVLLGTGAGRRRCHQTVTNDGRRALTRLLLLLAIRLTWMTHL